MMSRFSKKLPEDFTPDNTLSARISEHVTGGELSCAEAFKLAKTLGISKKDLGHYANYLDIRLTHCQIGLFGHTHKLVQTLETVEPDLSSAVNNAEQNGVISCAQIFEIAEKFDKSKVELGNACETLDLKIRQCRFGAF